VLLVLAGTGSAGGTGSCWLYWLVLAALAVLAVLPEDIQLLLQKSCASAARKNGGSSRAPSDLQRCQPRGRVGGDASMHCLHSWMPSDPSHSWLIIIG
jgi:hypothetical protein